MLSALPTLPCFSVFPKRDEQAFSSKAGRVCVHVHVGGEGRRSCVHAQVCALVCGM